MFGRINEKSSNGQTLPMGNCQSLPYMRPALLLCFHFNLVSGHLVIKVIRMVCKFFLNSYCIIFRTLFSQNLIVRYIFHTDVHVCQ